MSALLIRLTHFICPTSQSPPCRKWFRYRKCPRPACWVWAGVSGCWHRSAVDHLEETSRIEPPRGQRIFKVKAGKLFQFSLGRKLPAIYFIHSSFLVQPGNLMTADQEHSPNQKVVSHLRSEATTRTQ